MKLRAEPCPCGCDKFIIRPLFGCQCSTLCKTDAEELVRRWNSFESTHDETGGRDDGRFDFKVDPDNGMLIGPDNCDYSTEAEAMYFGVANGCGCGRPEEVHKLLVDCLKQFDGDWPKPGIEAITEIVKERPDVVAEFIAHYLDHILLTEHGSSVYGSWLTDLGRQFLEIGPH